ncbi:MAG: hypothetical protein IJL67_03870 [Oscillospiraceae bacterium]|nr:hypothetical protein [Oscillospiraceae bacterium]
MFGYSVVAGLIIAILTIITIFKRLTENMNFISYIKSGLKRVNDDGDAFYLAVALVLSALPVIIVIAIIKISNGISNTPNQNRNTNTNSNIDLNADPIGSNNGQKKSNSDINLDNYNKIKQAALSSSNNVEPIPVWQFKNLHKIVRENPGISDEELAEELNVKIDTARAFRPTLNLSYQEIYHSAGSSNNKIQQIVKGCYDEICTIVKNNPGISDEDLAEKTKTDVETARAYRPALNLTFEEINHLAGNTSNNMQQIPEAKYSNIRNFLNMDPGISNIDLAQKFNISTETARALRSIKN